MKNKLSDLNNHLFEQLERLNDDALTPEKIEHEAKRGAAMVAVADQILEGARVAVSAAKLAAEHGHHDAMSFLPEIEGRPAARAVKQIEGTKR